MALGFVNPSRAARLAAVILVAGFGLAGCESLSNLFGQGGARDADKPAEYVDRPVDQIYADAWKKINQEDYVGAAKQFDEVERQHPYSIWARRAMLMSAYCSYKANHYTDAIAAADGYIQLHPGSKEVGYAFYLKAVSLYEQIVDVGRDQSNTEDALTALQDVVQRFPDTEYARDATLKIDLTLDHLAGKEMAVGRYYLRQQDYIGAINRFRSVVEQYQKTSQIAEALERLTEAYYALGIYNEAQNAAAVLGANYPGSPWYQDAYKLLTEHGMKPQVDDRSWLSKTFGRIL
ncbi:MAG: outer membrane protein assembly factor BamD [Rhizomicrobium sp.]